MTWSRMSSNVMAFYPWSASANARGCSALAPELFARQPSPLGHGLKLGPDNPRVEPTPQPTVGPRDDVLSPHQVGVAHQTVSHQFRVLYEIGGVRYDAWDEDHALRQPDVLPHFPLM